MNKIDPGKPFSLSFAGCGFLGLYHLGVASCLREYAPISKNTRICGASAGALAAMALACDLPLGESTSEILKVAIKARSRALGPFHPSFDVNKIIYDGLMKTLPDDAHIRANGRLFISVTKLSDGKNVLINQYQSKDDLIKVLQSSCFIPIWSGFIPPKFNGVSYIDGGFSNNLPTFNEKTLTVSPFAGESDICPLDNTYNLFQMNIANTSISLSWENVKRISRILFAAQPEKLSQLCEQGYFDCLRYLQRNNKISCIRCLAIHFTLEKEDEDIENDKHFHHDPASMENCRDCENRRQIAGFDSLPESVVQAIQEACDEVNKGYFNWLFRSQPMKLLSILSIPALLPIDITIALLTKIYQQLPDIRTEIKKSLLRFVTFLKSIIVQMESSRDLYSAKFSCQLSVKEFDYCKEEALKSVQSRKFTNNVNANTILRKKSIVQSKIPKVLFEKTNNNNNNNNRKSSEVLKSIFDAEFDSDRTNQFESTSPASAPSPSRFRKTSYAGREMSHTTPTRLATNRRRSMIEIGPDGLTGNNNHHPPERLISQLEFDFKLDMKNSRAQSQDHLDYIGNDNRKVSESKTLDIDISDIDQTNAIQIANRALDWEKELLEKCSQINKKDQNFDRMFEITKTQDAIMAYYYTDENNKVKFTELFKIDADDMKIDSERSSDDDEERSSPIPITTYNDSDDGLLETLPESSLPKRKKNFLVD